MNHFIGPLLSACLVALYTFFSLQVQFCDLFSQHCIRNFIMETILSLFPTPHISLTLCTVPHSPPQAFSIILLGIQQHVWSVPVLFLPVISRLTVHALKRNLLPYSPTCQVILSGLCFLLYHFIAITSWSSNNVKRFLHIWFFTMGTNLFCKYMEAQQMHWNT